VSSNTVHQTWRESARADFTQPMSSSPPGSVFDYLDNIRERPSMYIGEERPLHDLESLLWGYQACLGQHGMVEAVPSMTRPFTAWLRFRNTTWSLSCGWANAVEQHSASRGYDLLDDLFHLVEEYRELVPTVVLEATLQPHHQPTGRRVKVGTEGRMMRSDRVQVVQYRPVPIHLLRFFSHRGVEDVVLDGADAAVGTNLDDAKRWLADEFELGPKDWSERYAGEQEAAD
jgi:hypothetical protein